MDTSAFGRKLPFIAQSALYLTQSVLQEPRIMATGAVMIMIGGVIIQQSGGCLFT
jgi:hypothetical protein